MNAQCQARVQAGTGTYMLRNSERQCKRSATEGHFCKVHARFNVKSSGISLAELLAR